MLPLFPVHFVLVLRLGMDNVSRAPLSPSVTVEARPSSSNTAAIQADRQRRRQRVLIAIIINMTVQLMCMTLISKTKVMKQRINNLILIVKYFVHDRKSFRLNHHSIWRRHRPSAWCDITLLNAETDKEFSRRCRVNRSTFFYICSLLAPALQKDRRGGSIPVEIRIALSLNRLGSGNYLLSCGDLFGMSESLASIVVRQFCVAVLATIRPLVIPKFTKRDLPAVAAKFESKHGLPFIMGAIDGSHIPIIAPPGDPAPFYNRKGFYLALLQGIVDGDTRFWDWDFGWAGSLHDYTLFLNSAEGQATMRGDYKLPYKLIGDAAYPYRTCMYVPFKGTKETLDPAKAHWNFIQSSTRMCVERAFGVLKGRWRILLRRNEMKLNHLSDVVGACICLHNLCILQKDFVDASLVSEAQTWLHRENILNFDALRSAGTMQIVDYGKAEVERASIDVEELIRQAALPQVEYDTTIRPAVLNSNKALKAGVTMHQQLAKNLFHRHLKESTTIEHPLHETNESSAEDD